MTYRNSKLLRLAAKAPECFMCRQPNDGTVVMAHSNQQRDGKGTGHKAADYRVAALCSMCHALIDSGTALTRAERVEKWEEAHRATMGWLFEAGWLEVAA